MSGDKNDGWKGLNRKPLYHLESAQPRHLNIQQDDFRVFTGKCIECGGSIRRLKNRHDPRVTL